VVVDAALGSVHQVDVPESLVLPRGAVDYTFSLVAGRANRRPVPVDFRLTSAAFPLDADARVRLRLNYRFGVENGYQLSVVATEDDAPFSEIPGTWVPADHSSTGEPGPVPTLLTVPLEPADWTAREDDVAESLRTAQWRLDLVRSRDDSEPERTARTLRKQLRWLRTQIVEFSSLGDPREFVELTTEAGFTESLRALGQSPADDDPADLDVRLASRLREEALIFLCALDGEGALGEGALAV